MKILRSVSVLILLISVSVFGEDTWRTIESFEGKRFSGRLEYNSQRKQVKLFYKKKNNWGDFKPFGPLRVSGHVDIDSTMEELKGFFERNLFDFETQKQISERVDEFRYLSPSGCQAIFLNNTDRAPAEITDLINKFETVLDASGLSEPVEGAFRSILIDDFATEAGNIQLRLVIDNQGNFLKFSFAKQSGDLRNHKLEDSQYGHNLYNESEELLIGLNREKFDGDKGLLRVDIQNSRSLLEKFSQYYLLEKGPDVDWDIKKYTKETFARTKVTEGVALTSMVAEHKAVVQLQNSDIAFDRISEENLKYVLNLVITEPPEGDTHYYKQIEEFYNSCMAEKIVVLSFEGETINDDAITQSADACFERSALELASQIANQKGVPIAELRLCLDRTQGGLAECLEKSIAGKSSFNFFYNLKNNIPDELSDVVSFKREETFSPVLRFLKSPCEEECQANVKASFDQVVLSEYLKTTIPDYQERNCHKEEKAKEIEACTRDLYRESSLNVIMTEYQSLIKTFTKEDFERSQLEAKNCLSTHIEGEAQITSLISRDPFFRTDCLNKVMSPYIEEVVVEKALEKFEKFNFLIAGSELNFKEAIKTLVQDYLKVNPDVNYDQEEVERIVDTLLPTLFSSFQDVTINNGIMQLESSEVDSTFIQNEVEAFRLEVQKVKDVTERLLSEKPTPRELQTVLNEFGKNFLTLLSHAKTPLKLREQILYKPDADEIETRVHQSYDDCFKDFSSNQLYPLSSKFLECEKERLGNITLELMKRSYEQRVSQYFELSSIKANDILSPLSFFNACLRQVPRVAELEEFNVYLKGCQRITEYDLSYNITRARIEDYIPVINEQMKTYEQLSSCYEGILLDVENFESPSDQITGEAKVRDVFAIKTSLVSRSSHGSSLNSVYIPSLNVDPIYRRNDRLQVSQMIKAIGSGDQGEREAWNEKLDLCEEQANQDVGEAFREYVISKVPTLDVMEGSEEHKELMRSFLDKEMVDLLLGLRDKISNPLRGEEGVLALKNFIDTLSDLIDSGFVYDSEQTKTELIVFKNEFKGFLRYANRHPEGVTLEDTHEFFKGSELSEHLSLAVLAQKTSESFQNGLQTMKTEEIERLFENAGCRAYRSLNCLNTKERKTYQRINEKYRNLNAHVLKMTKAYDFRRILSPDSPKGEEMMNQIRDLYLRPKILGRGVSQRVEERIMSLVGEAILKDNTAGGFADLFVQEAAQFQLDEEKERRWGITEFFFFDDQDFDWETLRETEAGERAISYYSRYIMLPRFLGQHQSKTTIRIRQERFRRLLTDAQWQNSK